MKLNTFKGERYTCLQDEIEGKMVKDSLVLSIILLAVLAGTLVAVVEYMGNVADLIINYAEVTGH